MSKVAIVTDSVASIPERLIQELNINWVAYYIHRGTDVLRDLVSIQRDEFLEWLATARTLPTTASPGPGDYVKIYEHVIEKEGTEEIISIHISSKTSGAFQAAMVAKSMIKENWPNVKIDVVDSLNASMCQGWMVVEAARAALRGKKLEEISTYVRRMIPITRMIQTADTLKYLYMGGRIGRAKSLAGTLLNIKPLIGVENGIVVPLGQARSRSKAYQAMVELVESAIGVGGKIKVAYVHAGALPEVLKIKQLLEERIKVVESFIAELSPALAVHTGPGTAGLCYYPVFEA